MIAQRLSASLLPVLEGIIVIGAGWCKALGLAIFKFVTWLLTDFATVAAGAAIVWGVHLMPGPWANPIAWITGGVLTILFVGLSVKPLR